MGTFLDIGVGFITNQEVNPGMFLATIGQKTSMKLYPSMYNQLLEERPVAQSATTTNTKVDISSDFFVDGVNERPRYHEELEEKVKKLMQLWSETSLEYRILKPKFLNRNCTLLESCAVPPKQYKAVKRGKNRIVNLKLHIVVLNIYSDNNNFICFSFG